MDMNEDIFAGGNSGQLSGANTGFPCYNKDSDQDSLHTEIMSNFINSPNLNEVKMTELCHSHVIHYEESSHLLERPYVFSTNSKRQVDNKLQMAKAKHDKEIDSFVERYWNSMGDLDFDTFLRTTDSIRTILGDEVVDFGDGFLSPSANQISDNAERILVPDITSGMEGTTYKEFSSLSLDENVDAFQKEQVDGLNMFKKWEGEENRWKQISRPSSSSWVQSYHNVGSGGPTWHNISTTPELRHSSGSSQQLEVIDVESLVNKNYSDYISGGHEYTSEQFPHGCAGRKREKAVSGSCICSIDPWKNLNSVKMTPEVTIAHQQRSTGQRKKQQKTIHDIRRQQEQFGDLQHVFYISHPISSPSQKDSTSFDGAQEISNDLLSMENMFIGSPGMSLPDTDGSMLETIYFPLHAALAKLDIGLKLRVRDSMYRLARNAQWRQSITDGSRTPATTWGDFQRIISSTSETNTNSLDRIVAQLLFNKASKLLVQPRKEEFSESFISFDPGLILISRDTGRYPPREGVDKKQKGAVLTELHFDDDL